MKKIVRRMGIIIASVVIVLGVLIFIMFQSMNHKTEEALAKQINVDIDMNKVQDGIYAGSSDGGMVQVEVEVEVEDHKITAINLIKHEMEKENQRKPCLMR